MEPVSNVLRLPRRPALTSLQLAASRKAQDRANLIHTLQKDNSAKPYECRVCKNDISSQPCCITVVKYCSTCCFHQNLHDAPLIEQGNFDKYACAYESNELARLLRTFGDAVHRLEQLEHLGLHQVPLIPQLMSALAELLSSCPRAVTTLTLTTVRVDGHVCGVVEKLLFFRAVAMVQGLRELHMPDWEAFVGDDATVSTEPLHSLIHLESIFLTEMKQTAAFPSTLIFQSVEKPA